jgi:hypothetical protein
MELHLNIIGIALMFLGSIHIIFPRYFNWQKELGSLALINRQMMYIHALFVALVVFLTGLLCFTSAADLISTPLGKKLSLGFGIFWSVRLVVQFFGYSSELWKGKLFETIVHIIFSMFWTYLSVVFLLIYMS